MTVPTIRVFVSSPGDVIEERHAAERVLDRLKYRFAADAVLVPIFWEKEPLRATSHFQAEIVRPSQCDIVVCILWARLGTPLPVDQFARPDGRQYLSGTEFEFEDGHLGDFRLGRIKGPGKRGLLPQASRDSLHGAGPPEPPRRRPKTAAFLRTMKPITPLNLYNAACGYGWCAQLVARGQAELTAAQATARQEFLDLALDGLREAVAAGYDNAAELAADPDLSLLHPLPAFKQLIEQLQKTPAPAPPAP